MVPWQLPAHAGVAMDLRERVVVGILLPRIDARGVALFEVDRAERLVGVLIIPAQLAFRDVAVAQARNVLRAGQRVEAGVEIQVRGEVEAARRIVERNVVIADQQRVTLARALQRAEQIVEVRLVVPVGEFPRQRLPRHVAVPFLSLVQVAGGRVGDVRRQHVVFQRVFPLHMPAAGDVALVAGDDGIGAVELQLVLGVIGALALHHRVEIHLVRRTHGPGFHDGMFLGDFRAQEFHAGKIVQRLGIDAHRLKPVPGIVEHDHGAIRHRQRMEKAGHRIRQRVPFPRRDVQAVNVGDAGVVAGGVGILAVVGKHAAFRNRAGQGELGDGRGVAREQIADLVDAEIAFAVDAADRGQKQRTVVGDIEVRPHRAVVEGDDLVCFVMRRADAHQRVEAVQAAHAPDGFVDGIEGDVPDARVFQQHLRLAGIDIDLHQVAHGVVVGGEEGEAVVGIEGERRRAIEHRAFEVGQLVNAAILQRDRSDIGELADIAETGDQPVVFRVVERARHRAQRGGRHRRFFRHRIFLDGGEVLLLPFMLEGDPVVPRIGQRLAEHLLELGDVVALGIVAALQPRDHLFGAVGQREIGIEARAVEIGIGPDLEIDGIAFGFEAHRVEEAGVVAHHRAEDHLVVAALCAAQPAAHPCLHEHGAAFQIPARHPGARLREIIVENRFGMIGDRRHLAVEEIAPECVVVVPHIERGDMHHLVVHNGEEALAWRPGFEGGGDRRDIDGDAVERRGAHRGPAIVGQVLQKNDGLVPRLPVEHPPLEGEGVLVGLSDVRGEIGLDRIVIDQPQIVGLHLLQIIVVGLCRARRQRKKNRQPKG